MKSKTQHYDLGQLFGTADKDFEFVLLNFNELQALGRKIDEDEIEHHHKHSFYIIGWVDKGFYEHIVDKQTYKIKKNDLYFICPGQIHENNFSDLKDVSGGAMMISSEYFSMFRNNQDTLFELTFIDNAFANPQLTLKPEAFQTLRKTIDLIASEYKQHTQQHTLIFQSLLTAFFLQIQRLIDKELLQTIPKHSLTIYKKFKHLIEVHYREKKGIADYASSLNITPRHLHRIIKESFGKTPTEILRNRVILEAKRQLTVTDKSISEIAYSLGFMDSSYFNKVFKTKVGITPLEFRNVNVRILP